MNIHGLELSGTDVNLDIARALNLNESRGFLVIDVAPSSPVKKAGIIGGDNTTNINGRPITLGGDIILKIDNKDIQNIHDILAYIESKKNVGDSILVTVLRDGIIQFNTVKLGSNLTTYCKWMDDIELVVECFISS